MRVGTVQQLWRYPVKSMAGEPLDVTPFGPRGIPGDRGWAVFDETRAGISNAKRLPALRGVRARCIQEPGPGVAPPPAEMVFPDGTRVRTDTPEAADRLSTLVGRAVSLRRLGAEGEPAAPRVSAAGDDEATLRRLMGLLPDEPEADMSAFTPERLRELRRGNFFDAFPLHLLTRASLRAFERKAPELDWDSRRFRANLLIETDDAAPSPELAWVGERLRIGRAVVEVVMGCPRCVMVTQAADDVPEDHRIMRTLVREARHTAGVYVNVVEAGEVRVGDPIEPL